MKRILCVTLSILMILLVFPTVIFASEGESVSVTTYTSENTVESTTSYTDIVTALNSLVSGKRQVVTLSSDVVWPNNSQNILTQFSSYNANTKIEIVGTKTATENYSLKILVGSYGFYELENYNLTLTNIDIIVEQVSICQTMFGSTFAIDSNETTSELMFNNCNLITSCDKETANRAMFQLQTSGHTFNITLNDCNVEDNEDVDGRFLDCSNGAIANVTLNNTEVNSKVSGMAIAGRGGVLTLNVNDSDITHLSGNGYNYNSSMIIAENGNVICNVKGDSHLTSIASYVHTGTVSYEDSNGCNRIFKERENSSLSINLTANENGIYPTLKLDHADVNDTYVYDGQTYTGNELRKWNYFVHGGDYNDEGATYIISASVAKKGVYLPTTVEPYYATTGEIVYGNNMWTTSVANNTEDVVFIPVERMFDIVDGASVRLSNPSGIRFESWIDDRLLALDDVTFGMLLAPTGELTSDTFTIDYVTENGYINLVAGDGEYYKANDTDTQSILRAALTGIPVNNDAVNTKFSARAYVIIGEVIYYADYDEYNSRSMYYVADAAMDAINAGNYEGWENYTPEQQSNYTSVLNAIIAAGENA